MATYINYGEGEEDATVQGAEWLRTVLLTLPNGAETEAKFTEKFKELNANPDDRSHDVGKVFDHFLEYSENLFSCIPETRSEDKLKEVESFFALVLHMLLLLEDDEHLNRATTQICKLFSSDTTHPELRLRLLMMLYNTYNLPTFEFRYRVFKNVVDYAAKAGLFDQVLPYLDYLDAWMADWEKFMTVEDKRILYRDISACLRKLNKRGDAFAMLKRYHMLFRGEDDKVIGSDEATSLTVQLLKDAIQLPSVIQFDDLLSYDTVKSLGKSKKPGSDLAKLGQIFLSGSVQDLRDFYKANKKLFEEHDIVFNDALAKIQLLTLATLAHGRSEMSLKEVALALEETEDKVEPLVVRAISEGIIDGRIDQLNHTLLCKSAFQRKFEKEEWGFLDTKLTCWIDNLESVIQFIGDQKETREKAALGA